MEYYVYIMSSTSNYTIYTGVTNDLVRRVYEHRTGADPDGFTTKYAVKKLVYYESQPMPPRLSSILLPFSSRT